MIRQFKLGIRLMRYAFGVKMCAGFAILFFLLGILLSFISARYGIVSSGGGLFLIMPGMWLLQLLFSLVSAGMVQASPWSRPLQTSIQILVGFVGFAASYVVIILLKLPLLPGASEEMRQSIVAELLLDALLAVVVMIYFGTANKFFVTSTVVFVVLFLGLTSVYAMLLFPAASRLSFGAAAAIGGACLIVGAFLQYGLLVLVYKYPPSKKAQLRSLQKYM